MRVTLPFLTPLLLAVTFALAATAQGRRPSTDCGWPYQSRRSRPAEVSGELKDVPYEIQFSEFPAAAPLASR